ncbi:MAG TPA: hypothetical protein VHB46_13155 [Burkholderiales bacterium]|nr:hypothetical protein [Burkholderiales bacterium]
MNHWVFYKDNAGRWRWSTMDENLENNDSAGGFKSAAECLKDAERHGYVPDLPPQPDDAGRL